MKHTPGPWTVESDDGVDFTVLGGKSSQVRIAVECSELNGRLIAAAPELLEALLNALPYVEDVLSDKDQLACFKPGTVQAHAKAIREAIAKATP